MLRIHRLIPKGGGVAALISFPNNGWLGGEMVWATIVARLGLEHSISS